MKLSVFAMLFTICYSCSKEVPKSDDFAYPDMTREQIPSLTDYNIVITMTENGLLKTRMTAPIQSFFDKAKNPYRLYREGVHLENFLPTGELDSEINCNYAIYWDKNELWEASSNVKAKNSKGEIFESDLIYWDTKSQKIYTNEFMKVTTEDKIIYGNGFTANQDFSKWEITKVSGIIPINLNE